jgi:hypothetical protein
VLSKRSDLSLAMFQTVSRICWQSNDMTHSLWVVTEDCSSYVIDLVPRGTQCCKWVPDFQLLKRVLFFKMSLHLLDGYVV